VGCRVWRRHVGGISRFRSLSPQRRKDAEKRRGMGLGFLCVPLRSLRLCGEKIRVFTVWRPLLQNIPTCFSHRYTQMNADITFLYAVMHHALDFSVPPSPKGASLAAHHGHFLRSQFTFCLRVRIMAYAFLRFAGNNANHDLFSTSPYNCFNLSRITASEYPSARLQAA